MNILIFRNLVFLSATACSGGKLAYEGHENKVTKLDLSQIVTVAGKLRANRVASIVAPYDGYVRKIYVKVGQEVKKGDPVISISTNLDETYGFYPMKSPFGGKVTQIATKEGEYIVGKSGDKASLVQIEDVGLFELEVEVPELDLPKLQVGQPATIKLAAVPGAEFPGKVKSIALSPKEQSGNRGWGDTTQSRYRVAIELVKQSPEFKSGLSATVDIQSASKNGVLALPGEYLTEFEGGDAVKLKDGTYKKIKVGLRTNNSFEILEGINEGDTVVMDGLGQQQAR